MHDIAGVEGMVNMYLQRLMVVLVTAVWAALLLAGCGTAADRPGTGGLVPHKPDYAPGETGPWALAVVGSDYFSSSVSVVDIVTGALFYEGIVDSGSALPGLTMALSGDVVLPSSPSPDNTLIVIDRYPNSVLTLIDPETLLVRRQISVATGFGANPHDVLVLNEHEAWVTRYERNARAGREAFDQGEDILVIDPATGDITGRIDLTACADDGLQARPDRLLRIGDRVWVSLNHLSKNFMVSGPARFAEVDIAARSVVRTVEVSGVSNCEGMVYDAGARRIYSTCSSLFRFGVDFAPETSGVIAIDPRASDGNSRLLLDARQGDGRPFGFDIDLFDGRVVVMRFGDPDGDIPDRLVAVDPGDGLQTVVHTSSSAFGLGGFWTDARQGKLYVGDADARSPRVYVYSADGDGFAPAGVLDVHPHSGLPPRILRPY